MERSRAFLSFQWKDIFCGCYLVDEQGADGKAEMLWQGKRLEFITKTNYGSDGKNTAVLQRFHYENNDHQFLNSTRKKQEAKPST